MADLGQSARDAAGWVAGRGNHRLIVSVTSDPQRPGAAATVRLERRWRDPRSPGRRGVLVVADGATVERWGIVEEDGPAADLYFEPVAGDGEYAVYVLPVAAAEPAHYPADSFADLANPDPEWLARHRPGAVTAQAVRWEHRSAHHAWSPMELRATPRESAELASRWPEDELIVFAEGADQPLRLQTAIPACWLGRKPGQSLEVTVAAGGRAVWQLAVWASSSTLRGVGVTFDLVPDSLAPASSSEFTFTCLNSAGSRSPVDVPAGEVRALWCGVEAASTAVGHYHCQVTVTGGDRQATVPVVIRVVDPSDPDAPAPDAGMNRLWWLVSDRAAAAGPTAAFTPVKVAEGLGNPGLDVLGRSVRLDPSGLPASLVSRFSLDGQSADGPPTELLADAATFLVEGLDGRILHWSQRAPAKIVSAGAAESISGSDAEWTASASAGPLDLALHGRLDYDGTISFEVDVFATARVDVSDIRLELPLRRAVTSYVMGLGVPGGNRRDRIEWRWGAAARNQDSIWIGVPHAGLQLSLRDERYARPLNTNFYRQFPLVTPESWANDGRGTVVVDDDPGDDVTRLVVSSGERRMQWGDHQRFDFRIALTPFKPVDPGRHFARRYVHSYVTPDEALEAGATTINLHHAIPPNPYLNYPLLAADELRRFVSDAHAKGVSVRLYDTIRELSTRAPELWALLHLDHGDLFVAGDRARQSWLHEHVDLPHLPGWYAAEVDDTTLLTRGTGRLANFYVESLAWLISNCGIDGLYLDDVAFDRETMRRVRHVLEASSRDPDIDLHSANQFNPRDGYASSANLYLELMPWLDRLWFGEYFDYGASADYWLVEMSGLPFGLTGEMLEGGGHPWRGMLYGMSSRLGIPDGADPRPVWRLWDLARIGETRMHGWWVPHAPVRTGRDDVLATTYIGADQALVALASWAGEDVVVDLEVDASGLGLPGEPGLIAPVVGGLQERNPLLSGRRIKVPADTGAFVLVRPAGASDGYASSNWFQSERGDR